MSSLFKIFTDNQEWCCAKICQLSKHLIVCLRWTKYNPLWYCTWRKSIPFSTESISDKSIYITSLNSFADICAWQSTKHTSFEFNFISKASAIFTQSDSCHVQVHEVTHIKLTQHAIKCSSSLYFYHPSNILARARMV